MRFWLFRLLFSTDCLKTFWKGFPVVLLKIWWRQGKIAVVQMELQNFNWWEINFTFKFSIWKSICNRWCTVDSSKSQIVYFLIELLKTCKPVWQSTHSTKTIRFHISHFYFEQCCPVVCFFHSILSHCVIACFFFRGRELGQQFRQNRWSHFSVRNASKLRFNLIQKPEGRIFCFNWMFVNFFKENVVGIFI